MRKAQVTTFIIIGIILIVIFALLFFFARRPGIEVPIEAQPLKLYVEDCLESTTIQALQLVGIQGGYTIPPDLSLETDYSTVAYHYYGGNATIPTKETVESQISLFVENGLDACIQDFSAFKEQGFNIQAADISAETTIGEKEVFVKLDYPVTLIREDSRVELNRYSATVPIRLSHIYDIAALITAKTIEDPDWVDMTFLSEFDVDVDILPYDEESFVYSIRDENSLVNNEPYTFLFANKFVINQPPILTIPNELTFADGESVIFKVNATDPENDVLTFSDDTAMFDITEDGVILFTPEVPGEYNVIITVEDTHGNLVSKIVKFIIEE